MSDALKLALIVSAISTINVHCWRNFREEAGLADRRFDPWVTNSSYVSSVLNCARKCKTDVSCLSFQFSSYNGECRLLDTIVLHRDAGVSEVGWKYYVASHRRCRDGFIDGRSVDICFLFAGFHALTEGNQKCAEHQSGLIVLASDEENHLLYKLIQTLSAITFPEPSYSYPYIHGHWNGSWMLDDGIPLPYTNWNSNQPQNTDQQSYIKVMGTKWRTAGKEKIRPIICSHVL